MIPGSNLLKQAMRLIAMQQLYYYKFLSRSANVIGNYVPVYDAGVKFRGSLQPMSRKAVSLAGLDLNKEYVTVYAPQQIIDIQRNKAPDRIQFLNQLYEAISVTAWFNIDGWVAVICVAVEGTPI